MLYLEIVLFEKQVYDVNKKLFVALPWELYENWKKNPSKGNAWAETMNSRKIERFMRIMICWNLVSLSSALL